VNNLFFILENKNVLSDKKYKVITFDKNSPLAFDNCPTVKAGRR